MYIKLVNILQMTSVKEKEWKYDITVYYVSSEFILSFAHFYLSYKKVNYCKIRNSCCVEPL